MAAGEGDQRGPLAAAPFYESRGEGRFDATELTRGPWDPSSQHAGPPAALIGRAIEGCEGIGAGASERVVGRVTFEILAPVPIAPLRVRARVERGGRRVDMVEATLTGLDGEPLVRARAWRLLRRRLELPAGVDGRDPASPAVRAGRPSGVAGAPPPPKGLARSRDFFPTAEIAGDGGAGTLDVGYHTAMEYRFATGSFLEQGPATTWMRMLHPLVDGEEPSPLQRVLIAADSGNGISAALDFRRYVFVNVDLSVHLSRMPAGEWVCLDSLSVAEPTGAGLTDTMLLDEEGPIGRAAQTLMIAER